MLELEAEWVGRVERIGAVAGGGGEGVEDARIGIARCTDANDGPENGSGVFGRGRSRIEVVGAGAGAGAGVGVDVGSGSVQSPGPSTVASTDEDPFDDEPDLALRRSSSNGRWLPCASQDHDGDSCGECGARSSDAGTPSAGGGAGRGPSGGAGRSCASEMPNPVAGPSVDRRTPVMSLAVSGTAALPRLIATRWRTPNADGKLALTFAGPLAAPPLPLALAAGSGART